MKRVLKKLVFVEPKSTHLHVYVATLMGVSD